MQILKSELAARQRRNESYSLRSFARDLGLHPGTLSAVLSGKRKLPKNVLGKISTHLNLSPNQSAQILFESGISRFSSDINVEKIQDDEQNFLIIAEWEHFALLSLMDTQDFIQDAKWIATRLGISMLRADVVATRLINAGLIKIGQKGEWQKSKRIATPDGISSVALRRAHDEELVKARDKLRDVPMDLRSFTSMTIACNPKSMPVLKELIRKFRKEVEFLAEDASPTEVYQLCVQLFPLTQV